MQRSLALAIERRQPRRPRIVVEQLAQAAGVAATTVKPRVRKMVALGSLTLDKRREGSGGAPRQHFYTCTDSQPDQLDGDASAAA